MTGIKALRHVVCFFPVKGHIICVIWIRERQKVTDKTQWSVSSSCASLFPNALSSRQKCNTETGSVAVSLGRQSKSYAF